MGIFIKSKKGGMADIIRCDEEDYLIWKWHPNRYEEGTLKREHTIRTNSKLRVKNGEVAVFFYKQKDGHTQDYIIGPYEDTLKTKNLPVLTSIIGLWYEKDTPFQAEVFFINVSKSVQIKFGVPYFDVVDPRYPDFEVPVAVRGTATFKINDYRNFIEHHQLMTLSIDDLKKKIIDTISRYVKDAVINSIRDCNIPAINIESQIDKVSEKCESKIKEKAFELYGVDIIGFDIATIEVDKDSDSYQELKYITKNMTARQVEAATLNYEESLRIQREEGQYAQHMQTRQTNLGAYQTEVSGNVGIAAADALGKMGENGVGNVNIGGGTAFNPVNMMAGMAVGSVVGQNMANALNNSINPGSASVPPKIPTIKYFVAIDGKAQGPFDIETLKSMISNGTFTMNSLVWKEGMAAWQEANTISELSSIFPPKL